MNAFLGYHINSAMIAFLPKGMFFKPKKTTVANIVNGELEKKEEKTAEYEQILEPRYMGKLSNIFGKNEENSFQFEVAKRGKEKGGFFGESFEAGICGALIQLVNNEMRDRIKVKFSIEELITNLDTKDSSVNLLLLSASVNEDGLEILSQKIKRKHNKCQRIFCVCYATLIIIFMAQYGNN